MPHSHPDGWAPKEIGVFTDSILSDGAPLARVTGFQITNATVRATYESARPIVDAELCFTRATGYWSDRKYNSIPADVDRSSQSVSADIPPYSTVLFLNLYDDLGCVASTEHIEL